MHSKIKNKKLYIYSIHAIFSENADIKMRDRLVLLLFVCFVVVEDCTANPDAKRLYENLLANYDRYLIIGLYYAIRPACYT